MTLHRLLRRLAEERPGVLAVDSLQEARGRPARALRPPPGDADRDAPGPGDRGRTDREPGPGRRAVQHPVQPARPLRRGPDDRPRGRARGRGRGDRVREHDRGRGHPFPLARAGGLVPEPLRPQDPRRGPAEGARDRGRARGRRGPVHEAGDTGLRRLEPRRLHPAPGPERRPGLDLSRGRRSGPDHGQAARADPVPARDRQAPVPDRRDRPRDDDRVRGPRPGRQPARAQVEPAG